MSGLRCLVVLALLAVAGCGTAAPAAHRAATTSPATGTPVSGATAPHVATRVLQLRDPSRVTDPGPGTAGARATPGRILPTTLFYPSSGGPYPLVEFSHGFSSAPDAYAELLTSWAAAGFVVAAPTFPLSSRDSPRVVQDVPHQPADVSFVLTSVLALNTAPGDPLAGRIDTRHVAVAGHSAGAVTTLGLLSPCCLDHRVSAAVVLAGSTRDFGGRLAAPGVPVFFVHGADDTVLPIADDRREFASASPAAFLTLTHGTHSAPYDDATDPASPVVRATTTDFLRWALAGDRDALDRLRADAAASGTGVLTADRLPH